MITTGSKFFYGLAALLALVRRDAIPAGSTVVFVHTGGIPELFTRSAGIFSG